MKSMLERFESKYEPITETVCWVWTAGIHNRGYGHFHTGRKEDRKSEFAHRISYELYNGVKPSKTDKVCHKCDNPSCVRPDHLFLGSHADNMSDMVSKKRYVSHNQKVDLVTAEKMIRARGNGVSIKDIAEMFNISPSQASRVTRGCRKYFNEG